MRHKPHSSTHSRSTIKILASYGTVALLLAMTLYPAALVTAVAEGYLQTLYGQLVEKCTITAYLRGEKLDDKGIVGRIKSLPGTRTVRLLSPQEGYREFEARLGKDAEPILTGVRPEELPATLQVTVDREHIARLEPYLKQLRSAVPETEDIRYPVRELEQSLIAIGRIAVASDYLRYLLLAVAIVGGLCACAIAPNFSGKPFRNFSGFVTVGLGGGLLAALILLGTCNALSGTEWRMSIATDVYLIPIGLGLLLGVLTGCTRLAGYWWTRKNGAACEYADAVGEDLPEGPVP